VAANGKGSYALLMIAAVFLIAAWFIVTVLAPLLEKKAKGQPGGVPLVYFLLVTPMMCGAYYSRLGYYIVGGLTVFFLAGALISCTKNIYLVLRKT
jgi:hypothetical protein